MELFLIFIIFGAIIFLGFLGDLVFRKTNIPDVIWLILFGIIISSIAGFSKEFFSPFTAFFTNFALVFILFEGAINTNIKYLIKGMPKGFALTVLTFIFSVVMITILALVLGLNLMQGLLLGAILSGTCDAMIIPLVKKLKMHKQTSLVLIIESALSDVLGIVFAVTLIKLIQLKVFSLPGTINTLISSFSIALIIGIGTGIFWLFTFNKLGEYGKSYLSTIAILLVMYGVVEYLGASGAIAAFAFGIILGNSKKVEKLRENNLMTSQKKYFYSEISFFLKSFFFVYLGLLVTFPGWPLLILSFFISLAFFFVRPLAVFPIARKMPRKEKAILEVLVPKGIVAVVLAQLAMQNNLIPENFVSMIPLVIFFTILLSTIFLFFVERGKFYGFSGVYSGIFHAVGEWRKRARKRKVERIKREKEKAREAAKKEKKKSRRARKKKPKENITNDGYLEVAAVKPK